MHKPPPTQSRLVEDANGISRSEFLINGFDSWCQHKELKHNLAINSEPISAEDMEFLFPCF